jgi:hypothetical protein
MPMSDDFRRKRHADLSQIVRRHGGRLKARSYTVLHEPITVQCREGHQFRITPKNLLRGLWCVKCRPTQRQTDFLVAAQRLAHNKGGKCLSDSYETARSKLKWRCENSHQWEATYDNVANKGSWCPECAAATASDRKVKWWRQARTRSRRR